MHNPIHLVSSIASLASDSGGPSRSTTSLCSSLAGVGIHVSLVSLNHGRRYQSPILPSSDQVRTQLVPCLSSKKLRLQWSPEFKRTLVAKLKDNSGSLLHDNGAWAFTNHVAAQAARLAKAPFVVSPRGMLNPWAVRYKSWKKQLGWTLFQHKDLSSVTAFHATSVEEAEGIRQLGLRQPIAIIPNGVDMPQPHSKASEGQRTALFMGRVHPVKGLLPLVNAWAQVRPSGWKMIVAGPDEDNHRAEVEALVRAHGLTEQFRFTGLVEGSAKAKLFQQADLFILPSFSENFSIAVAEALSHAVAVLTTRGTPWRELPTQKCGWWVEVGEKGLAEGLFDATGKDASCLHEMGERGRRYVEQTFSWPKIGLEMRAFYEWVLGIGPKPPSVVLA